MEKFIDNILLIISKNTDKCLHFSVGFILSTLLPFNYYNIIFVIIIAIGKEIYDKFSSNHTSDWKDALITMFGGILPFIKTLY